ncbi:fibronectin type III domain-containing protein [Nocardioides dilutus]
MRRCARSGYVVAVIGLVIAASLLTVQSPAEADTFPDSGFATETVATVAPYTLVGMAFAPDGRMFVWQKNGVVRVVKNGQLLPTPFIDLSAKVNTFDDRGFWGLAFDPQFATNGRVYLSYTFEDAGNPNSSAPRTARLTRVTADPANPDTALPGSEVVILGSVGTPPCSALPSSADCIGSDGGSHTLGSLHFADDGTLFVGVGDGSDGDANALRAQNLDSPNGKILRIRPDGSAPPDNPFYDGTNSWRSRVWLYGVRNPFGFSLQAETGEIWFGDVGWNTWEEVDHGGAGANFGWPCFEGTGPQPYFQSQYPSQCALTGVTPPFHTYDHTVGSAVIGGPFYTGTTYPQQYRDNFFFADYSGRFIKRVVFDSEQRPVSVEPFATGVPDPVALTMGPDGLIYYLSFTTGEINRIRYNGPVAKAAATPTNGPSPLAVSFSSAGSSAPGGGTLSYLWDFGDGATSTAANPSHTYTTSTPRRFTARLTVSTASGASSSDTVDVTVGSVPPTPTISAPTDGTTVLPGQTINYQGSATDLEDGPLPASALTWTVLLHHNTHVHTFVAGAGDQGSFVAEDHGSVGTFSYEIILEATDSTGLEATTSVNVPVGSDTSPPSVPTGLAAVAASGQVSLGWTASSDNAAVTGYRVERCQGAGCTDFAQVGTPAGTTFTDTGLAASTLYRFRVRAVDASGNLSGYSSVVEAATPDPPPTPAGLVGAWAFNEGTGTTTADASGRGNQGTLVGATWTTQGRYGGALSFDGSSSLVRVADSASLDLSTAMTLSAWIMPTANQSGWRTIMQRQTDAYFLNASYDGGALRPAGGGTFGSTTSYVGGPTASPLDAWTHVALTYDGAVLRLFVNGTQVATRATTGTIQATDNPLWIGGNNPYGEYFTGRIDEVRVYNRALTETDIQADMSSGILPAAGDTSPPTAPTGLSASAGPGQVNLTWTASTDNVGVSGYRVERCQGAGCTSFAPVGTPSAAGYSDTGLAPSTTYRYQVRAVDAAGNLSAYSSIATATTPDAADTTAPSAPTALSATAISTTRVDLTWTASTDDVGVTGYRVERCQGTSCTDFAQVGTPTGTAFTDPGLAASTEYRFRVRAVDAAGNLSAYSSIATVTTPAAADTTAPSPPTALSATAVSSSRIDLTWTPSTDNVGVAGYRVERCQGTSCTSFAQVGTPSAATYSDTGLLPATTYRFRVRAIDAAGNLSAYSSIATATTPAAGDTTAPSAPTALSGTAISTSRIDLTWTASTDNVEVTGYRVERCRGTNCTSFTQVGTPTAAAFSNTGLAANTNYRFRVRAVDAAGNLSAYSAIVTIRTLAKDTTRPTTPTALSATAVSATRIDLTWTASTDNVGVTGYRVERCQGAGCTSFAQVGTPTATTYSDAGLTPSTTYRYRVRAVDAAGNLSTYSSIATSTSQAVVDTSAPSVPTGLAAVAGVGQVDLSWTASTDDVGVTGYRVERCQGAGCTDFAQVGTPAGTTFTDTGLAASTLYRFRVRAVDASGNLSGYSSVVEAATPDPPPTPAGLVGAWAFNEGTGTTTADASGRGNQGTLVGATWTTQGRYGGALSFDGSSSLVRVADSASLDLSTAMTLSAWIMPTANQSGWRTIMQRQTDAYFLNASYDGGALRPAGGGTFGSTTSYVGGPTASPLDAWTHVALTYDGAVLRLFVNGTQVATRATTGTIQATDNPLWIGGNNPYGEYFTGRIDEVRVYNRALTETDIQADMSSPVPGS